MEILEKLKKIKAETYETSDKGFGRLFADLYKNKHRYNPTIKDFMSYDGKRWVNDIESLMAKSSAKELADALIKYAIDIDSQGKYLKSVLPLCNLRNRRNMLTDAKDVYPIMNEELDKDDYLFNVQNGVIDLSGNSPKFIEHNPDLMLSKIANVEYNPNAKCDKWLSFLNESLEGDQEKIKYLQKLSGFTLTGCTQEEKLWFLYGQSTRNGKGTFCETIIYLLGNYATTIRPESLAKKKNNDSRTANGDIAKLIGSRMVNCSEPDKRMLFDTALVKSLTGRDTITARELYQREFSFTPKFKLIINTNHLPVVTDDTLFSSDRVKVITFNRHFAESERDLHLKDKLKQPDELSGILNWCIEGYFLYKHEGLSTPKCIQKDTDAYRHDSDKIGNFLSECFVKDGKNTSAKLAYELYETWCDDCGYTVESKGNFFADLKTKGLFASSGTVEGRTVRNVLKGYSELSNFVQIGNESDLPF